MSSPSSIGGAGAVYASYAAPWSARGLQRAGASGNPLGQLFSTLDSDGDGNLSAGELSRALQVGGGGMSEQIDAEGLFSMLDQDGDGVVSENEFAQALPSPLPRADRENTQSLLAGADDDAPPASDAQPPPPSAEPPPRRPADAFVLYALGQYQGVAALGGPASSLLDIAA